MYIDFYKRGSAGIVIADMSVRPSVCHILVLNQNEQSYDMHPERGR